MNGDEPSYQLGRYSTRWLRSREMGLTITILLAWRCTILVHSTSNFFPFEVCKCIWLGVQSVDLIEFDLCYILKNYLKYFLSVRLVYFALYHS